MAKCLNCVLFTHILQCARTKNFKRRLLSHYCSTFWQKSGNLPGFERGFAICSCLGIICGWLGRIFCTAGEGTPVLAGPNVIMPGGPKNNEFKGLHTATETHPLHQVMVDVKVCIMGGGRTGLRQDGLPMLVIMLGGVILLIGCCITYAIF